MVALLLEEGSRATWHTTVQITSEGREHSNLTYNISHCVADRCWKGAQQPDGQHYLQLHRPLLEGSKVTWWTTLSVAAQTVVGRERNSKGFQSQHRAVWLGAQELLGNPCWPHQHVLWESDIVLSSAPVSATWVLGAPLYLVHRSLLVLAEKLVVPVNVPLGISSRWLPVLAKKSQNRKAVSSLLSQSKEKDQMIAD